MESKTVLMYSHTQAGSVLPVNIHTHIHTHTQHTQHTHTHTHTYRERESTHNPVLIGRELHREPRRATRCADAIVPLRGLPRGAWPLRGACRHVRMTSQQDVAGENTYLHLMHRIYIRCTQYMLICSYNLRKTWLCIHATQKIYSRIHTPTRSRTSIASASQLTCHAMQKAPRPTAAA